LSLEDLSGSLEYYELAGQTTEIKHILAALIQKLNAESFRVAHCGVGFSLRGASAPPYCNIREPQ